MLVRHCVAFNALKGWGRRSGVAWAWQ